MLSVAYSPDGKFIAAGAQDGTVAIWDVATGAVVSNLKGHHKPVRKVTFTPGECVLHSMGCTGGTQHPRKRSLCWSSMIGTQLWFLRLHLSCHSAE